MFVPLTWTEPELSPWTIIMDEKVTKLLDELSKGRNGEYDAEIKAQLEEEEKV